MMLPPPIIEDVFWRVTDPGNDSCSLTYRFNVEKDKADGFWYSFYEAYPRLEWEKHGGVPTFEMIKTSKGAVGSGKVMNHNQDLSSRGLGAIFSDGTKYFGFAFSFKGDTC